MNENDIEVEICANHKGWLAYKICLNYRRVIRRKIILFPLNFPYEFDVRESAVTGSSVR